MNKLIVLVLLFLLIHAGSMGQELKRIWTEQDREFLLNGLDTTRIGLLKEVQGLSSAQVHFKPDISQWSIAEILEHLGVWEEILLWDLFANENSPARYDLAHSYAKKDSATMAYATDPAKGSSPLISLPLGRFGALDELLNYFNRFRDEVIRSVRNTKADYRVQFIYRPREWGEGSQRDLHQYTLLFIAHTTRHANQVRRVKAHKAFPRV